MGIGIRSFHPGVLFASPVYRNFVAKWKGCNRKPVGGVSGFQVGQISIHKLNFSITFFQELDLGD